MATLNTTLEGLLKEEVLPAKDESAVFKKVFDMFMSNLLGVLRNDPYVGALIGHINLVGSASSRLRVNMFDEFDVNLVLTGLLSLLSSVKIEPARSKGFVSASVGPLNDLERMVVARVLEQYSSFISPNAVVDLLYSAVMKAVGSVQQLCPQMIVEQVQRHYPAITLLVVYQQRNISIDLVPVVQLPWSAVPAAVRDAPHLKAYYDQAAQGGQLTWMIVPKTPNGVDGHCWRMDFPMLEKQVFKDRNNMKNGIRLLKWLRNVQGRVVEVGTGGTWRHLSSYIIRTAFLWKDEMMGSEFWKQDLGSIVIEMLRFLEQRLRLCRLDDFWCEGYNLLSRADVHPDHWVQMADRLQRIANGLSGPDPAAAVRRYFYRNSGLTA